MKDYDNDCLLNGGIVMKWDDVAEKHKERGFIILAESGWHDSNVDTEAMVIRQALELEEEHSADVRKMVEGVKE